MEEDSDPVCIDFFLLESISVVSTPRMADPASPDKNLGRDKPFPELNLGP